MDKRIVIGIITFIIVIGIAIGVIVLVGSLNKESVNTETNNTGTNVNTNTPIKPENKPIETNLLKGGTYKVPLKKVYIDVPNFQDIEEGYTEVFIVHESKYVAITSDRKYIPIDLQDAHTKVFDKLKINMENYEGGMNYLTATEKETVTINGIEAYRYEGTINYGTTNIYDKYAVGYSFIMDGIPVNITGSVIDDNQSQELCNEIEAIVEAMMRSARTEE